MNVPGSPRALPMGLLGMLVMVLAAERYVARHEHDFGNTSALRWADARSRARQARDAEIVCIGSSLTTDGVQPLIIEEQLGRRVCNLSVFAGPNVSSYYVLKRAIESGAHPRVVIMDCQDRPVDSEDRWAMPELWRHLRLWPRVLTVAELADLSWTARDASLFAATTVMKVLPSARARFEVRDSILKAFKGEAALHALPMAGLLRNWRVNHGAQVLPARGKDSEAADEMPRGYPEHRGRWTSSPITETYTRRLLELTSRHEIAVFWTLPPLGPRLTAWREREGVTAYETRFARDIQSRAPGVTLIDGRSSRYPARVFSDGLHLGRPGAVVYSRSLASILATHWSRPGSLPRIVQLPPYRDLDRAGARPLEDVWESGHAVATAVATRARLAR